MEDKTMEAWLTAAVVMRTLPVGRAHLYDLHAIDLMSFTAPKGKLAGNEKLLRVMITSIRLSPEFSAQRNKGIASYYQLQAQKEAKIDKVNADLLNFMTQTYQHPNSQLSGSWNELQAVRPSP